MKLSKEEIKTIISKLYKCVAALELVQEGRQVEAYGKKFAETFTEIADLLSQLISLQNASVIGDLVVDENGNCSPLNTKS